MASAKEPVGLNEPPSVGATESSPVARVLAWIVLAVMAIALVYTGWIALANFNHIGV